MEEITDAEIKDYLTFYRFEVLSPTWKEIHDFYDALDEVHREK